MLTSNERFKKEFNQFKEKISLISDESIKNDMNNLLKKLLEEAKRVDQRHEEVIRGTKLATDSLATHRTSISALRQQIVKKLDSCEQAGLIK
jgi:hypothetical protein